MGKFFILILVAILQDFAATGSQKKIVQISLKEIVQISLKEIVPNDSYIWRTMDLTLLINN